MIVCEPGTHPECCFISGTPSRTKHASTSVAPVPSQASVLPRRVHAAAERVLDRTRKRQLVAIRIGHVKIPLAPGGVSRTLWIKSFFPQVFPEQIHIRHVENHSPPASYRTTLLQIKDRRAAVLGTKRREKRIFPSEDNLHAQNILVEPHRP